MKTLALFIGVTLVGWMMAGAAHAAAPMASVPVGLVNEIEIRTFAAGGPQKCSPSDLRSQATVDLRDSLSERIDKCQNLAQASLNSDDNGISYVTSIDGTCQTVDSDTPMDSFLTMCVALGK